MIPSEYRLEKVASRIAQRLEGIRRSYESDPDRAAEAFRESARDMLDDVINEFQEDGFTDHPDRHASFLHKEILGTFLPRYTRIATRQTEAEASGFGLGFLHGPIGRVVMFFGILVIGALMMRGAGPFYVKFSVLLPLVFSIFLPDAIAWAGRHRYRTALKQALADMQLLQDRALDYLPGPQTVRLNPPPEG
jgi:hypothetical protein